jgi:hypothetical protein
MDGVERARYIKVESQAHQRQQKHSDDEDHVDRYLIRGLVPLLTSLFL